MMRTRIAVGFFATLLATRPCHADARACIAEHEAGISAREAQKPLDARPSFVACTRAECPSAVREECAQMLEQLERQIPSVVVAVKDADAHDLVDLKLFIDGKPVSEKLTGQAIELNPGQHEFRIVHAKAGSLTQRALIVEGEKRRLITLAFPPARSTKKAAKPRDPAPQAAESSPSIPAASWILGGVGVVALGSFGYFALSGRSKENDLDGCAPGCAPSEVDVMQRRYLIADISLGVALVALGSATGIALLSPGRKEKTAGAQLDLGPARVGLSGSF